MTKDGENRVSAFLRGFQSVFMLPSVSKGFQRVSKHFQRVSKGFQSVSKGFQKCFQRVSNPKEPGFKRVSE